MDSRKAKALVDEAVSTYQNAEGKLLRARELTTKALDNLGGLKLKVWDQEMTRFRKLYAQLHPIEMINRVDVDAGRPPVTAVVLGEMEELSGHASQLLVSGALGLGAGALAGVAAYGGAVTFAAASTGTAIATLGGAAATNATLAWFGGGSLAAGGLGMAGGTLVLGGLVAGPLILVGGSVFAIMAHKNLAKAQAHHAEATKAAKEMRLIASALNGIRSVTTQFAEQTEAFRFRFAAVLNALDAQIARSGTDYRQYSSSERELVHLASLFAQTMRALLETPYLTPDGALRKDYQPALANAKRVLASAGTA